GPRAGRRWTDARRGEVLPLPPPLVRRRRQPLSQQGRAPGVAAEGSDRQGGCVPAAAGRGGVAVGGHASGDRRRHRSRDHRRRERSRSGSGDAHALCLRRGCGMNQDFRRLCGQFLKREYADSPVRASALGLTQFDDQLDDVSASACERRRVEDQDWLRQFRAVRDGDLDLEERIDRDFVVSILRGREITEPLLMWKKQPATYLNPGLSGVFTLFLHRLRPEPELVAAARSRLEKVPDNIAAGVGNIDWSMTPRVYVDRAIGQARAAVRYARELLPAEVRDAGLREKLALSGAVAAKAFDQFATFLETNKTKASGSYAVGEQTYTALLREKELLAVDARQLRERGREEWDRLDREMRKLANEIDGSEDWAALLERLNQLHAPTPDGMRDEYAEWTER